MVSIHSGDFFSSLKSISIGNDVFSFVSLDREIISSDINSEFYLMGHDPTTTDGFVNYSPLHFVNIKLLNYDGIENLKKVSFSIKSIMNWLEEFKDSIIDIVLKKKDLGHHVELDRFDVTFTEQQTQQQLIVEGFEHRYSSSVFNGEMKKFNDKNYYNMTFMSSFIDLNRLVKYSVCENNDPHGRDFLSYIGLWVDEKNGVVKTISSDSKCLYRNYNCPFVYNISRPKNVKEENITLGINKNYLFMVCKVLKKLKTIEVIVRVNFDKDKNGNVLIDVGKQKFMFPYNEFNYLTYENAFLGEPIFNWKFNTTEFLDSIKRMKNALGIKAKEANPVSFEVVEDEMVLIYSNLNGTVEKKVGVEISRLEGYEKFMKNNNTKKSFDGSVSIKKIEEEDKHKTMYNLKYLIDIVSKINDNEFLFSVTEKGLSYIYGTSLIMGKNEYVDSNDQFVLMCVIR